MKDAAGPITLRGMTRAALFGALTAVGAFILIPIPPVPVTLQTLFLYLAASTLGGALGAWSQTVYLLLGVIGLPVFAGGKAGLGVLIGPTGGYLLGFVPAAWIAGHLIALKARPGFAWVAFSLAAGTACLYGTGVAQLAVVGKLGLAKALTVGILPFLPGDVLKIAAATGIFLKVRDRLKP